MLAARTLTRVLIRPLRVLLPITRSRRFAMAIAENYDEVLKGKYPAKDHARKVAKWIAEKGGNSKGTIYLEAQKQKLNEVCNGEEFGGLS
jgi:hypothetical protein